MNCLEVYLLVQTRSHETAAGNESVRRLSAPGGWERLIQFIFTFITVLGTGNSEGPSLPSEVLRLRLEAVTGCIIDFFFFILNVINAPKNLEAVGPDGRLPKERPCWQRPGRQVREHLPLKLLSFPHRPEKQTSE